jgi:hypothetical protein
VLSAPESGAIASLTANNVDLVRTNPAYCVGAHQYFPLAEIRVLKIEQRSISSADFFRTFERSILGEQIVSS